MVLHRNNGALADRLGNGLQNRVEQFDSARHLLIIIGRKYFYFLPILFLDLPNRHTCNSKYSKKIYNLNN